MEILINDWLSTQNQSYKSHMSFLLLFSIFAIYYIICCWPIKRIQSVPIYIYIVVDD